MDFKRRRREDHYNGNESFSRDRRFESRQPPNLQPNDGLGEPIPGRVYIAGFTEKVREYDLERIFSVFGPVKTVRIIYDHETGRSKGYGFVTMMYEDDCLKAFKESGRLEIDGRIVTIQAAKGGLIPPRKTGEIATSPIDKRQKISHEADPTNVQRESTEREIDKEEEQPNDEEDEQAKLDRIPDPEPLESVDVDFEHDEEKLDETIQLEEDTVLDLESTDKFTKDDPFRRDLKQNEEKESTSSPSEREKFPPLERDRSYDRTERERTTSEREATTSSASSTRPSDRESTSSTTANTPSSTTTTTTPSSNRYDRYADSRYETSRYPADRYYDSRHSSDRYPASDRYSNTTAASDSRYDSRYDRYPSDSRYDRYGDRYADSRDYVKPSTTVARSPSLSNLNREPTSTTSATSTSTSANANALPSTSASNNKSINDNYDRMDPRSYYPRSYLDRLEDYNTRMASSRDNKGENYPYHPFYDLLLFMYRFPPPPPPPASYFDEFFKRAHYYDNKYKNADIKRDDILDKVPISNTTSTTTIDNNNNNKDIITDDYSIRRTSSSYDREPATSYYKDTKRDEYSSGIERDRSRERLDNTRPYSSRSYDKISR